jgi:fructosamine-3-kinase
MAGGSICEVHEVRLADGRAAVVKETPYPAEVEADGLAALAAAGAPVPEVLACEGRMLVLAKVGVGSADGGSPAGRWAALGARLAEVHATSAAAGELFGWPRQNRIGPLLQDNTEDGDWARFYAERRIRPHLDAPALPAEVRLRLERALDGPLAALLPPAPPASLIHGDLWSGNVVDGCWLVDPAVQRADRELELAFAAVFGGIPPPFWDAYAATWPLADGWEERRPALQLHHLLVHVRLFGAAYVGAVTARLDALRW